MKSNRIGRALVGGVPVIADQDTLIKLKVKFTPLGERDLAKYLECQEGVLYGNTSLPGMRILKAYVEENNLDVEVARDMKMGRRENRNNRRNKAKANEE
jgi:hypothetical protein